MNVVSLSRKRQATIATINRKQSSEKLWGAPLNAEGQSMGEADTDHAVTRERAGRWGAWELAAKEQAEWMVQTWHTLSTLVSVLSPSP